MDDPGERPRGVLTEADRRYLLGEADLSHDQSRRNTEARIRSRVENGIKDFALLVQYLKGKDRRQVFEKNLDDQEFRFGLMGVMALTYLGIKESDEEFETFLAPAISRVEEGYVADSLETTADVEVSLAVDLQPGNDIDEVVVAIEEGRPVTTDELYAIVVGSPDRLRDVERVVLETGRSDLEVDEPEFLAKIADFLDADLEWIDDDQVRISDIDGSFGEEPPRAKAE